MTSSCARRRPTAGPPFAAAVCPDDPAGQRGYHVHGPDVVQPCFVPADRLPVRFDPSLGSFGATGSAAGLQPASLWRVLTGESVTPGPLELHGKIPRRPTRRRYISSIPVRAPAHPSVHGAVHLPSRPGTGRTGRSRDQPFRNAYFRFIFVFHYMTKNGIVRL